MARALSCVQPYLAAPPIAFFDVDAPLLRFDIYLHPSRCPTRVAAFGLVVLFLVRLVDLLHRAPEKNLHRQKILNRTLMFCRMCEPHSRAMFPFYPSISRLHPREIQPDVQFHQLIPLVVAEARRGLNMHAGLFPSPLAIFYIFLLLAS